MEEVIMLMCHRCEKMFPPDRTFHCSDCGLLVCGDCSEWVELGEPEQDIPTGKTRAIQAGKVRVCHVCIEDSGEPAPQLTYREAFELP
jgi:hypothetical protein